MNIFKIKLKSPADKPKCDPYEVYDTEFASIVMQILKLNLTEKNENTAFDILEKCSMENYKLSRHLLEEYKDTHLKVADVMKLSEEHSTLKIESIEISFWKVTQTM